MCQEEMNIYSSDDPHIHLGVFVASVSLILIIASSQYLFYIELCQRY